MKHNQQRRDFNYDGNLGTCRRVEQSVRSSGRHHSCHQTQASPTNYVTPLERRVDEIMRARRPIT